MCASRRSAIGPQLVAIALIGLGVASCSSDSGRFLGYFRLRQSPAQRSDRLDPAGPDRRGQPAAAAPRQQCREGTRAVAAGMGSYQPANGDVTGSLPPKRRRRRPGPGKAARRSCLAPGETLETLSRRYGVPVAAIIEANHITNPGTVHPGRAFGDSAPPRARGRRFRRRRRASPHPRQQCLLRPRPARRELRSHRPPASTSWRRARRCTASPGFTASRCWCSPKPTIFRPIRG